MEKGEIISIAVTGLYTIVFVVVFIIQKSQIRAIQATANSMEQSMEMTKRFMEIFNIDEVKKFVDMKTESANLQALNLISDDSRFKAKMEEAYKSVRKDLENKGSEMLGKQIEEEQLELIKFAREMTAGIPEEHRNGAIEKYFPKTKRFFVDLMLDEGKEND